MSNEATNPSSGWKAPEADPHNHTKHDGSWWLTDCKGIPLTRVCGQCIEEKKSRYNSWVFTGYSQSDIDEQIEEDF